MKLIKSDSNRKFDSVYYFVNEFGGIEYTQDRIDEYASQALKCLEAFPESEPKNALSELVSFISNREY